MKMPEPVAWINSMKGSALYVTLKNPRNYDGESLSKGEISVVNLYDKQALIDLLEEAAKYADEMGMLTGPEIRAMKETL